MAVNREAAYVALAARLQSGVRSLLAGDVRRRLPGTFADLDAVSQPALCVIATDQPIITDGPAPGIVTLHATIVVFARADADPGSSAETALNNIVTAIETALEKQPGETPYQQTSHWTTLGGVVCFARPMGAAELQSGQTEAQGIATMSVEMVMAPNGP